jgi:hypothetical protein
MLKKIGWRKKKKEIVTHPQDDFLFTKLCDKAFGTLKNKI